MLTIDMGAFILSLLGTAGVAIAAARWLAGRAVDHALARSLETHKSNLAEALAENKAALDRQLNESRLLLESQLRASTELMLGERSAERSYQFEARKRLYTAVGPLRFQLIQASIQLRSRIASFERAPRDVSVQRYYGWSLLFRVGQVLALTELIERQIAHADFAVDPGTILLLRFRAQVMRALSHGDVSMSHPDEDWDRQTHHIFRDQLPIVAVSMVVPGGDRPDRVTRFDEFIHLLAGDGAYLQPLTGLIHCCGPKTKPIVWLRLLALAEACGGFLDQESVALTLDPPILDPAALLALSDHPYLKERAADYLAMLADFRARVAIPAAAIPPAEADVAPVAIDPRPPGSGR